MVRFMFLFMIFRLDLIRVTAGISGQSLLGSGILDLFGSDSRNCVYHFQSGSLTLFANEESGSKQQITSDLSAADQFKTPNLKSMSLLKLEAKCVISLLQEDAPDTGTKLQDLISDFKPLDRNVFVYLASAPPQLEVQVMINRPLVWINSAKMRIITVYCPTEGNPKRPKTRKVLFISPDYLVLNGKVTKLPINIFEEICANPMEGQVLTLADVAGFPNVILPNVLNNKHLSGYSVNIFLHYAKYFRFHPRFAFPGGGTYMVHNDSFSPGKFHHVMTGKADLCTGGLDILVRRRYDFGVYLWLINQRYITRPPRPIRSYGNISKPFPPNIWALSILSIMLLAILIYTSYRVYQSKDIRSNRLAKEEMLTFNFFLFAFAKLTEPDPLPWFTKWSTGRFAVFLWSFLSLFLLMFYTSNLRAYMVMVEYEKAPVDLYDIYNRGERVYIYDVAPKQRKAYLEATGQKDTIRYKVADLAEKTGGIYSPLEHQGQHRDAPKDMAENGAFVLIEDFSMPYLFLRNPLWRRENIYILPKVTDYYYSNNLLRKHSPATTVINRIARRAVEMGLVKFWVTEHLSTRSLTAPKPPQVGLDPLKLSSLYTSQMFFGFGMFVAAIVYALEMRKAGKKSIQNQENTNIIAKNANNLQTKNPMVGMSESN